MMEAVMMKKPGMVSVREMPVLQDGPPPGGFPPVRYARRIPTKGPSAVAIFLDTFGAFAYGMYQVFKGNKIRSFQPWKARIEKAHKQGKLVFLDNLYPSYSSSEMKVEVFCLNGKWCCATHAEILESCCHGHTSLSAGLVNY